MGTLNSFILVVAGCGGLRTCYVNGKLNKLDEGTFDHVQPGDSYWNPCTWGHLGLEVIPAIVWGN